MKFEDLDDKFEFEKAKKRSAFTKIRIATLLIIFIILISFAAKNNFSFAFRSGDKFEEICGPGNTLKSIDDQELIAEKSKRALQSNLENLKEIDGFSRVYVSNEPIGYKNKKVPVINIVFSYSDQQQKIIPKQICGFNTNVINE